ncbi:glutathione peroxidase [Bacteroidia bacterium]|nr:glutathione peroxidase [Bacteroidia bacterium]MDC0560552.1 glutathione peroxidase [Bacteroidia bacterium]MDC3407292.1 glutathione peroxidase [Bacteroidia bacterium]
MHIIYLINFLFVLGACNPSKANKPNQEMVLNNLPTQNFYNFSIAALNNDKIINMRDYQGKKILIVNVASRCGYTSQFADLQKLNELHGDIVQVIGVPCNQFLGQEPGTNAEIAHFCQKNYNVTFPLTDKIKVKGDSQHPLYRWLTNKNLNGLDDFSVSWNFNKFLIDENGNLINHFGSSVKPLSEELLNAIKS